MMKMILTMRMTITQMTTNRKGVPVDASRNEKRKLSAIDI